MNGVSRFRGRFKEKAETCISEYYDIPTLGDSGTTIADVKCCIEFLLHMGNYRFQNPDKVCCFYEPVLCPHLFPTRILEKVYLVILAFCK